MSNLACEWCQGEWNMDPIYGEDGDAEGLPFCCEECLRDFIKAGEPGQHDGHCSSLAPLDPAHDHPIPNLHPPLCEGRMLHDSFR